MNELEGERMEITLSDNSGYVDFATTRMISGWATTDRKSAPVTIRCGGQILGIVRGNDYRSDLFDQGIDPHAGFFLRIDPPLALGSLIEATFADGKPLTNSPVRLDPSFPKITGIAEIEDTNQKKPLLLIHLPKTGGTSLRRCLDLSALDKITIYNNQLSDPSWLLAFQSRKMPSLISGHYSYGAHDLLKLPPRYAIMLRCPIDRLISFYRYLTWLPMARFGESQGSNLATLITSGFTEEMNNHACRVIAGIGFDGKVIIKERWLLDLAIHNIENYFCAVGLLEHSDEFLARLQALLNCSLQPMGRENIAHEDPYKPTSEDMRAIYEFNALDIALYDHVYKIRKTMRILE